MGPTSTQPPLPSRLNRKPRVAVVGAGPSGAITIDALAREGCFDVIRVFERREAPGGCWLDDTGLSQQQQDHHGLLQPEILAALADRRADVPVTTPRSLEALDGGGSGSSKNQHQHNRDHQQQTAALRAEAALLRRQRLAQPRFAESSIYPYLETNVDVVTMQYSQEPIQEPPSSRSVEMYGPNTPFRHWTAMRTYVQDLVRRRGYESLISYNTTVERAEKVGEEWRLTLRKEVRKEGRDYDDGDEDDAVEDFWWTEWFDGLIVANGHFSVPYIPRVEGLAEFLRDRPGSVLHSKHFRGRDGFRGKRVVVVGASVSAADIAFDLVGSAESPVHAVMADRNANPYFGDGAFHHPEIARHPTILRIETDASSSSSGGGERRRRRRRTVHFVDGTSVDDVDYIIFGTGYSWTVPFLSFPSSSSSLSQTTTGIEIRNNRVPGLYQHVVYTKDPSLLFVGGVGAGLTFKIFEWQAVLAARVLSGRAKLPSPEEQMRWEQDRIARKGDGKGFVTIHPEFEEYFEAVRGMAGPWEDEDEDGEGTGSGAGRLGVRTLPPFDPQWQEAFMAGHERRKDMWRRKIDEYNNTRRRSQARSHNNNSPSVGEVRTKL